MKDSSLAISSPSKEIKGLISSANGASNFTVDLSRMAAFTAASTSSRSFGSFANNSIADFLP